MNRIKYLFLLLFANAALASNPTLRMGLTIPATGQFNYPQIIANDLQIIDADTAVQASSTVPNTVTSSTTFSGSGSTVTINQDLILGYLGANQCLATNGAMGVVSQACGGGSGTPALAIYNGSSGSTGVAVSTPTTGVNFNSPTFTVTLQGGNTSFITLSPSSVTLQGNAFNGNSQLTQTNGSGSLPASVLGGSILNQNTLQSGSTFYTSSGTVNTFQASTETVSSLFQVIGRGATGTSIVGQINGSAFNVLSKGWVGMGTAAPAYPLDEEQGTAKMGYGIFTSTLQVYGLGGNSSVCTDGLSNLTTSGCTGGGGGGGLLYSSFTAVQPVIYSSSTGQFSLTLINLSTGVIGSLPASSIAAGALPSNVVASSLTASGVTAGNYTNTNVAVNAEGQITAASNGSANFVNSNQSTLQAGATFYVSSGTVAGPFTVLGSGGENVTYGVVAGSFTTTGANTLTIIQDDIQANSGFMDIAAGTQLILNGTGQILMIGPINFDAYTETNIGAASGNTDVPQYGQTIHLTSALQSGATFYVSSGTATTLYVSTETVVGEIVLKDGTVITSTSAFGGSGSGTVNSGTAGRVAIYNTSTNAVGDNYTQSAHVATLALPAAGQSTAFNVLDPGVSTAYIFPSSESSPTHNSIVGTNNIGNLQTTGTINGPVTFTSTFAPQGAINSNITFQNTATYGIVGSTTTDNAVVGNYGEYVSSSIANVLSTGNGNYFDDCSITLSSGDWDVEGQLVFIANGATVSTILMGISTTPGNSGTGLTLGTSRVDGAPPNSVYNNTLNISRMRMSISGPTTYYLKANISYTVATPEVSGIISARRSR